MKKQNSKQKSLKTTSASDSSFKKKLGSEIVIKLLSIHNQIKIYHWQTSKYSTHKALDFLFDELNNKIDQLVETYIGKYTRFNLQNNAVIQLKNLNNNTQQIIKDIQNCNKTLLKLRDKHLAKSEDSDISNILDEIFGIFNKTVYLLTLH